MKRREFFKLSGQVGVSSLLLNGMAVKAFASPKMIENLCPQIDERVLVLIFLNGGNDGINNLVPLDQYNVYASARPNIRIPQNRLLTIDSSLSVQDNVGLHPSLLPFKQLYDQGKFAFIQGVGTANPNKSHFKATDLWMTGGDARPENFNKDNGWIGRYLDYRYPNYYGKPFAGQLDPLGIIIGSTANTGFHSPSAHALELNLNGQNPAGFYTQVAGFNSLPYDNIPETEQGEYIQHIIGVENSMNFYSERVSEIFNAGTNNITYPNNNNLANQLKTVAKLINGGSQTKVYICNIGGWDTHVNQVDGGDSSRGGHANNLNRLATAIKSFQDDLAASGQEDRVMGLAFSEFGRKIIENGNRGSDHGTLGPMYVFGKHVEPGVKGTNINLSDRDRQGAPNAAQVQHDYREVLSTVLQDWLGTPDSGLNATEFTEFYAQKLALITTAATATPDCYIQQDTSSPPVLAVTVFLEGYLDREGTIMHEYLAADADTPLQQPFDVEPFKYSGPEFFSPRIPIGFVDWILVELRDATDMSIVSARKACYLNRQGQVLDVLNGGFLSFPDIQEGSYHLAIYQRNHLPVISRAPIQATGGETTFFTFTNNNTLGTDTMVQVGNKWAMIAGDYNGDGRVTQEDLDEWLLQRSRVGGYLAFDGDGNAVVNANDHNLVLRNIGKTDYFNQ